MLRVRFHPIEAPRVPAKVPTMMTTMNNTKAMPANAGPATDQARPSKSGILN